jgi:hypothetical protein
MGVFLHLYKLKCMVHAFFIINISKGINIMISITFYFWKNEKPNLNNLNISNGELLNFMACNVIVHKKCLYGFTILKICNDGLIYWSQKN